MLSSLLVDKSPPSTNSITIVNGLKINPTNRKAKFDFIIINLFLFIKNLLVLLFLVFLDNKKRKKKHHEKVVTST